MDLFVVVFLLISCPFCAANQSKNRARSASFGTSLSNNTYLSYLKGNFVEKSIWFKWSNKFILWIKTASDVLKQELVYRYETYHESYNETSKIVY